MAACAARYRLRGGGASEGAKGVVTARVASSPPTERAPVSSLFPSFDGHQFLRLTTFRRSGEGVPTPVWFAAVDGGLGVFTSAGSGKVKRLRREGRVLIAPCSFRGRPKGGEQEAAARLVTGQDGERIQAALVAKYGWLFRMIARRRSDHAFIEIAPAG
jgi:PPOX class probable F420-dependent enzyme